MSQFNKKDSRLIKVINDNNLCISNNPKGIDINWPKSFAKLYYSKCFEEIYRAKKSPKILEINQENPQKGKLWEIFFNNPTILRENIYKLFDFNNSNKLKLNNNFDIIILKNYKRIDNIYEIINLLRKKLNYKGFLIIENVYFSYPLVLKLFFFQETKIFDYRLDKFLLDNCIIEIKNNGIFKNILNTFLQFYRLIIHSFIEILYYLIYKIKSFYHNQK